MRMTANAVPTSAPVPHHEPTSQVPLQKGDRVEIQDRFTGSWSPGFEVTEVLPGMGTHHVRIRRLSDNQILPVLFTEHVVRARP